MAKKGVFYGLYGRAQKSDGGFAEFLINGVF